MAERKVDIRDNSRRPAKEPVTASREQIEEWLGATSALEVHDRGMSYAQVAKTIRAVADALPQVGKDLSGAWKSGSSAKAQRALQLLNASGTQIADAMDKMSEALTLYGRDYLPQAIEEVKAAAGKPSDKVPTPEPNAPPIPPGESAPGDSEPHVPSTIGAKPGLMPQASQVDDEAARRALEKLNEHIVNLYDFTIPESVVVDLPVISPADGPATERDMPLNEHTPYQKGSYWDGSGSSQHGSGSPGAGSGGDDRPGSQTPGSQTPGSQTPGSQTPGDQTPGGDKPGTDTPGTPGTPDAPGASGGQDGGSSAGGPGTAGDGTTPPVIDNSTTEDRTTQTPDATTQDQRATESSAYQPPPVTTPSTPWGTTPPSVSQPGYPAPTSGTPAVIGGPGSYTQGGVPAAAASRTAGGGGMGAPFLPLGGTPAGEQQSDIELPSLLQEERDVWNPGEGSTSPVIG
ncbi:MAG: hypothetical protein HOV97_37505 [Nonomuraea sp.]|nr:hypothetical protein [Nonomuraea sp.]